MSEWFATRPLEPGVWLVAEPGHVNSFLVAGRDRAVLVDTGTGIGDIRPVVESLTDLDVLVVNTHRHWDHIGGNAAFGEVAIHELGEEALRAGFDAGERLDAYLAWTRERLQRFGEFRDLDAEFYGFLAEETTPRPLPAGFDRRAWRIPPCVPSRLLGDGDRLDLGGRVLRVLHTPGHTLDSICLLDETSAALFGGDTFNTGPIYAHQRDSDLRAFAASTARVAGLGDAVRTVYMGHFSRYAEPASFAGEVAEGFAAVVAGEVRWEDDRDEQGRPVKAAWFARFGVYARADQVGA